MSRRVIPFLSLLPEPTRIEEDDLSAWPVRVWERGAHVLRIASRGSSCLYEELEEGQQRRAYQGSLERAVKMALEWLELRGG